MSLCLFRLIEPVFRSIENCISGFLKQFFDCFKNILFKKFFNFSSLSDLARILYNFFCRFPPKFLQGFPPSRPVWLFYPSFLVYFHFFMHFFHAFRGYFRNFWFLGFLMIQGLFSKIDHWVLMGYWYIHVWYWLIWSIWGFMKNWKF